MVYDPEKAFDKFQGTMFYTSPEIEQGEYDFTTDIWLLFLAIQFCDFKLKLYRFTGTNKFYFISI